MNILKTISLNSILYAILLFLSVWGTLQLNKPSIPLSNLMYYGSLFALFYIKKDAISKSIYELKPIFSILIIGIFLMIVKGISNVDYADTICSFFKIFWVCILLEKAKPKELVLSRAIIITVLIINCLIMIYERSIMKVLFWDSEDVEGWLEEVTDIVYFRSSGITEHPVLGGFLVTMQLLFLQHSKMERSWKFFFTVLLFVALLCLNSRSNIVIAILVSLYFAKGVISVKKYRITNLVLCASTILIFAHLIMNTDWGGRLIDMELGGADASSMARLEILDFVDYINMDELLWGDINLSEKLMIIMAFQGIENGYIVLILKYGLIFGVPLIIALTYYQWKALAVYPKIERLIIFFAFIVMANTNPHIGHSIPWIYWAIYYYLFRPESIPARINK